MAINNNILGEIGDRLFFNTQIAVFGILNVTAINEETVGVTSSRFFIKKFRWSKDNLNWSSWMDFNLDNFSELNGKHFDLLFISFYYERGGIDQTGVLQFLNLNIIGNLVLQVNDFSTTLQSIFKEFIENDSLTYSVASNLLKKIYKNGILPAYLERGENSEDFAAFWGAICQFFSLFIAFSNKFDDILNDKEMLSQYLQQRGVSFVKEEIKIQDLQYISNNFLDELRKRGTISIVKPAGYVYKDESVNRVDGEWLRTISKNHYDEFLVDFIEKTQGGFFIDKSCHLYNGTNFSNQLNKTGENTKSFNDLSLFKILNPDTGSVYLSDEDGVGKVMVINAESYEEEEVPNNFGIGVDLENIPVEMDEKYLIKVCSEIDYELTFMIKRNSADIDEGVNLKVGVLGYNVNNWYMANSFSDSKTNIVKDTFIDKSLLSITKQDEWYFIRCIIYAKGSVDSVVENDFGIKKLKFNQDVYKVFPFLMLVREEGTASAQIFDMKFRPLIRGKNILPINKVEGGSTITVPPYIKNPCFVQNNCSVLSWTRNNSVQPDSDVENFINEYLLPYQKILHNIRLSPKTDDKQLLT